MVTRGLAIGVCCTSLATLGCSNLGRGKTQIEPLSTEAIPSSNADSQDLASELAWGAATVATRDLSELSHPLVSFGQTFSLNQEGETFEVHLPRAVYDLYQAKLVGKRTMPRASLEEQNAHLLRFLTPEDPVLSQLVAAITRNIMSPEEKAQALLDWVVQEVEYDTIETSDEFNTTGSNYFRFPVETLMEKRGDCEDLVFLYTSLCLAAEIDVVILRQVGHLSCAVKGKFAGYSFAHREERFFLADPTFDVGFRIGTASPHHLRGIIIDPLVTESPLPVSTQVE